MADRSPYLECRRHILLDMHIPDWDERFLSEFDPAAYVDLCASAGAEAVMVYCNSHAGQCFWPTTTGQVHRNLRGRDLVGETVELLQERGIAVCAYYSAIFNNWAYHAHPDWRLEASAPGGLFGPGTRYGQCCPANPDYLNFMLAQTEELARGYPFDAFFFDMVFWPDVCVCASCRRRHREEAGEEIPARVDWRDPAWCRFQAARERWLADAFRRLRDRVKASLPIPVFLNSDLLACNWVGGASEEICALNDLLGGDYEVRALFEISAALTPSVIQYMYAISGYGGGVSDLTPLADQKARAMSALAFGGQFMAIDAVEPDGKLNPRTYERLRDVFVGMEPYEGAGGGTLLADVGVYWSPAARVSVERDGVGLDELPPGAPMGPADPHWLAVQGALRALNEAHLPAGALSRADLRRLDRTPLVVLPALTRIDAEEADAIRDYVAGGGRLYASGPTSLLSTDGTGHDDFLLADLFGCHLRGEAAEALTYLKPAAAKVSRALGPLEYVALGEPSELERAYRPVSPPTVLEVAAADDAEVLMTLTVPYGGGRGTRDDQGWANIHSSPPWEDTTRPAVLRHRFGAGEVIYSTVALEGARGRLSQGSRWLFVELVRLLLGRPPTFEAEAHPHVWSTVFAEPERSRFRLAFLNSPPEGAPLPIPRIGLRLAAPAGARFTSLRRVPDGGEVDFTLDEDGAMRAEIRGLELFEMLYANYQEDR
ncbi:MAG: alpha-L-fucosidase [Actinobacteria bacterium]|nr:alpha-L-fucosidase [Actinomycetota bacterium]